MLLASSPTSPPNASLSKIRLSPKAVYGSVICLLPRKNSEPLTTAGLQTAWGRSFALRARELVFSITFPLHRAHLFLASVFTCIMDLTRILTKSPALRQRFLLAL